MWVRFFHFNLFFSLFFFYSLVSSLFFSYLLLRRRGAAAGAVARWPAVLDGGAAAGDENNNLFLKFFAVSVSSSSPLSFPTLKTFKASIYKPRSKSEKILPLNRFEQKRRRCCCRLYSRRLVSETSWLDSGLFLSSSRGFVWRCSSRDGFVGLDQ